MRPKSTCDADGVKKLVFTQKISNQDKVSKERDIKDSSILAAAILENVDFLITENKDCLMLNYQLLLNFDSKNAFDMEEYLSINLLVQLIDCRGE